MTKSRIDKPLTSGGPGTARIDLDEVIKIADKETIEFDALNEKLELLREAWLNQRKPGESFKEWFNKTTRDEIIRLTLEGGGRVIKFPTDLAKSKEPKVKSISLDQYFDLGRTLASLSKSELDTVKYLLNKTLIPKK